MACATMILIAGMHRTGTSALARVLNLAGAAVGDDLLPADDANPRGYWESATILGLHDRLLGALGTSWHDLAPLPDRWRESVAARAFVSDLGELVARVADPRRPFLVKDPRLALLTPLWIDVLRARGVRPVFAITVRHPDEVAASLGERHQLSPTRARLLWLRHLLEAEAGTRGSPRVFVHYERLLADPRRERVRLEAALGLEWPRDVGGAAALDRRVAEFLDPELRRQRAGLDGAPLPEPLASVYAEACAAAEVEGPPLADGFTGPAMESWRALGGPIVAELAGQVAAQRARMTAAVTALARGGTETVAAASTDLRFHVDSPANGAVVARGAEVRGWCFAHRGQPLGIAARAGAVMAVTIAERESPDVARTYPDSPPARHAGFVVRLDLPAGPARIVVEAWLGDGRRVALATRWVLVAPRAFVRWWAAGRVRHRLARWTRRQA